MWFCVFKRTRLKIQLANTKKAKNHKIPKMVGFGTFVVFGAARLNNFVCLG